MRVKLFILGILCFLYFVPVEASSVTSLVLKNIEQKNTEAVTEKRNIFADFKYRLFEKDTRDFLDYVLLIIFVVGLLIVMVLQNTRYYYSSPKLEQLPSSQLEDNNLELIDEVIEARIEKVEKEKSKPKINNKPGKKLQIKKD